jgi:hypothetical protein
MTDDLNAARGFAIALIPSIAFWLFIGWLVL